MSKVIIGSGNTTKLINYLNYQTSTMVITCNMEVSFSL